MPISIFADTSPNSIPSGFDPAGIIGGLMERLAQGLDIYGQMTTQGNSDLYGPPSPEVYGPPTPGTVAQTPDVDSGLGLASFVPLVLIGLTAWLVLR